MISLYFILIKSRPLLHVHINLRFFSLVLLYIVSNSCIQIPSIHWCYLHMQQLIYFCLLYSLSLRTRCYHHNLSSTIENILPYNHVSFKYIPKLMFSFPYTYFNIIIVPLNKIFKHYTYILTYFTFINIQIEV